MRIKLICIILSMSSAIIAQSSQEALTIIQKYKEATSIESLSSIIEYKNISKKGRVQKRTLEQFVAKNSYGEDSYNFLLRFTSPSDVSNTSALTIQHDDKDDDQWLYLPVLRSAKRISASKKSDRFMGTEMSYEDLSNYLCEPIKEHRYTLVTTETIDDRMCHLIVATTIETAKSQYSQRKLWIDTETHLLIKSEFYDHKEELIKRYTASDIRHIGSDIHRAHRISLENLKTKNKTEVSYAEFEINKPIDKSIFTKSYIETL